MGLKVRKTVQNRKGRLEGRAVEGDKKEEITSTEFSEGGNTIYTKGIPRHPNGGEKKLSNDMQYDEC